MVGKLGYLEKVAGESAHDRARAIAVKVVEGKLLHMGKQILTHLRLYQNAHLMADDRDYIVQQRFQNICRGKYRHDNEKCPIHTLRQIGLHAVFRQVREHKVNRRHQGRADHVDGKQLLLTENIGYENCKR